MKINKKNAAKNNIKVDYSNKEKGIKMKSQRSNTMKTEARKTGAMDKILLYANPHNTPDIRARYAALNGTGRPPEDLLAMNTVQAFALAKGVSEGLLRYFAENPGPVGLQIQRIGVASGAAAIIDLPASRAMASAKGASVIGGIRFYPLPDPSDSSGFKVVVEAVTIHFGPNARADAERMGGRNRTRDAVGCDRAVSTWFDSTDEKALKDAVSLVIKPLLTLSPAVERGMELLLPEDWNSKRALRALLMFFAYAMLPTKKKLIALGAGKPIITGELALAEHRLRLACKSGGASVVHRDGVPHFCFSELRRLGLDNLSVPLIELH
jgi:hypothetical protein